MKKITLLIAAVAAMVSGSAFAQKVVAADVAFNEENKANLEISVESETVGALVEFALTLPEGITVEKGARGYNSSLGEMAEGFSKTIRDRDNGDYYVLVYSADAWEFLKPSGLVISIPLVKDENLAIETELTGRLSDIVFTDVNAQKLNTESEATFSITDATTVGIGRLTTTDGDSQEVYTIGGQRVAGKNMRKGIYVMNGKKITVR